MELGLNISILIRQAECASGGFQGVCLSPCVEDNVGHCVSAVQIRMTVFYGSWATFSTSFTLEPL